MNRTLRICCPLVAGLCIVVGFYALTQDKIALALINAVLAGFNLAMTVSVWSRE